MFWFVCQRCGKKGVDRSSGAVRKWCARCKKKVIREANRASYLRHWKEWKRYRQEYDAKNRERRIALQRKYYAEHRVEKKERSGRYVFARELMKRVRVAREELANHVGVSGLHPLDLENCNRCIVKQGKLDCALKLYEANLVERDTEHGDKPVAPRCTIKLVREVKPVFSVDKLASWEKRKEYLNLGK